LSFPTSVAVVSNLQKHHFSGTVLSLRFTLIMYTWNWKL